MNNIWEYIKSKYFYSEKIMESINKLPSSLFILNFPIIPFLRKKKIKIK